jgi:hypothetical protein
MWDLIQVELASMSAAEKGMCWVSRYARKEFMTASLTTNDVGDTALLAEIIAGEIADALGIGEENVAAHQQFLE